MYVIADITCGGALTDDTVPVTDEMQHLARSIVSIYGAAADVEQEAIECHARAARLASEDTQRAIEHGVDSELRRSSSILTALADRATKMKDAVPSSWEDFLPEQAAVVIQLRASAAVAEAELIQQYRNANPSVQVLSFLVGAYEVIAHQSLIVRSNLGPESIPCPPPLRAAAVLFLGVDRMRATACTYRPARLLWRWVDASNHRSRVNRSGFALLLQVRRCTSCMCN